MVKCPLIKESPVSIECKVKEVVPLGSHDMFIAEVLCIDADEKYIDEKGAFDISKCNLIAYANGGYYALGKKVGKFGYSVQKRSKTKAKNLTSNSKQQLKNTNKKTVKNKANKQKINSRKHR